MIKVDYTLTILMQVIRWNNYIGEQFQEGEFRAFHLLLLGKRRKTHGVCFLKDCSQFIAFTMVTSGRPHRSEPEDTDLVDRVGKRLFKQDGWYHFLTKLSRENYGVTRRFAQSYDGSRVIIESLNFIVDKEFISQALGLPQIGELWFKGKIVLAMDFNLFLKDEHVDPDWKHGISTHQLKEEWQGIIEVIQRYITCDFHFTRTTIYLMRFLGCLVGIKELNLVNLLYKSLNRMSQKIQSNPSLKH